MRIARASLGLANPRSQAVELYCAALSCFHYRFMNALIVGASRGIGLALTQSLATNVAVAKVFAASRSACASEHLSNATASNGARIIPVDLDVTREASIADAVSLMRRYVARLDLIVYCAGLLHDGDTLQPEKRLADVSADNLIASFNVNAIGPLLIAKHCQSLLDARARAVFANLSARVGSIEDNRSGGWYAYRTAKAAQNMATRNLAIELRRRARGIICVAIHPGTVDTQLSRPFQRNVPEGRLFTTARAASQILEVISQLEPEDNGTFVAWDGQPVPW